MPSYVLPTLELGSTGTAVRNLQRYLNELGFSVAVDSIYGPATRQAVIAFQAQAGVPRDGIVGPRTWEALEVNLGMNVDPGTANPPQIPDLDDQEVPPAEPWITPGKLAVGGLILAGAAALLRGGSRNK